MYKVGIIGAGLVGTIRANIIQNFPGCEVVGIFDIEKINAESLAKQINCSSCTSLAQLYNLNPDIIIISTPTKYHFEICIESFSNGCHVLCEKPLSRYVDEAKKMVSASKEFNKKLKTGFDHRHLPNIQKAYQWVQNDEIGEIMFIRSRYGHGGRKGYEKEWQAYPEIAGGGELLSQGVHTLDLFNWFIGKFETVYGMVQTAFYDVEPLEDNAFALLKTSDKKVASMHVSWTQWKNLFSFEIFGKKGMINVEGRGGSYGPQTVSLIKKPPMHGAPKIEKIIYPENNFSWENEWKEFIDSIENDRPSLGNGEDGLEVMCLAWSIYRSVDTGRETKVNR